MHPRCLFPQQHWNLQWLQYNPYLWCHHLILRGVLSSHTGHQLLPHYVPLLANILGWRTCQIYWFLFNFTINSSLFFCLILLILFAGFLLLMNELFWNHRSYSHPLPATLSHLFPEHLFITEPSHALCPPISLFVATDDLLVCSLGPACTTNIIRWNFFLPTLVVVKSSPPIKQHPAFYRPDVLSVAKPTLKG